MCERFRWCCSQRMKDADSENQSEKKEKKGDGEPRERERECVCVCERGGGRERERGWTGTEVVVVGGGDGTTNEQDKQPTSQSVWFVGDLLGDWLVRCDCKNSSKEMNANDEDNAPQDKTNQKKIAIERQRERNQPIPPPKSG